MSFGGRRTQPHNVPLHVLLVDDTPEIRLLARDLLCTRAFDIETAESGEEALAILQSRQSSENRFDVVLSDLMMPVSGRELLARILERFPGLPVFVYSAAMDRRYAAELLAAGARGAYDKSVLSPAGLERVCEQIGLAVPALPEEGTSQPERRNGVAVDSEPVTTFEVLHRAHETARQLIQQLEQRPAAEDAIRPLAREAGSFHERLRDECEQLLQERQRSGRLQMEDARRMKHLLLDRISTACVILEDLQAVLQDENGSSAERARYLREGVRTAQDMLENFVDMLAVVEQAWETDL